MQYIQEDGTKRFAKNSRKEGCFHPVGGMDALRTAPAIVIAEGYATAGSISDAIGHATVAAFDSGNLMAVATALKDKYPDKMIGNIYLFPDVKRRKRLHRLWEVKPFFLSLLPENGKKIWPVLRTSMT